MAVGGWWLVVGCGLAPRDGLDALLGTRCIASTMSSMLCGTETGSTMRVVAVTFSVLCVKILLAAPFEVPSISETISNVTR